MNMSEADEAHKMSQSEADHLFAWIEENVEKAGRLIREVNVTKDGVVITEFLPWSELTP